VAVNALFNLKQIESQITDIQDKYKDEIDQLLEIIYSPSENENSDSGQFNDTSGTNNEHRSNESKESQYTRDVNYIKPGEEFMGNPPSIFLQTPSRKSRKSMTESIFHESDEEECDDKPNNMKEKSKMADEKTLNGLDMENDEEEERDEEEDSEEEESEKKGTSKLHSITNTDKRQSEKESGRVTTNQNMSYTNNQTMFRQLLVRRARRKWWKWIE